MFLRKLNIEVEEPLLPPPFKHDLLAAHWPLLLESCSVPGDPAHVAALVEGIEQPEPLLRLAEAHGVIAQLGAALNESGASQSAPALAALLRDSQKRQTLSTLSLTADLFRTLALLQQAGIEAAVVKGPVLSFRAYGNPAFRRYSDIDLLLRHSDVQRASQALTAAGFQARVSPAEMHAGKTPGQYFFRRRESGAVIELHTERTLRYFPRPLPVEALFQRKTSIALDGRQIPALSAEDEFVLISIHGAKHFWERLMWIADIAAVVRRHPELDWGRIRQYAATVGAERMVRVALLLAQRLLRSTIPASMKEEIAADSACLPLTRKIESWLPYAGYDPPPLARRALFRLRMRGHLFAGARYLTRLSLATTEEDWSQNPKSAASALSETLRRPFRLVKKYRKPPNTRPV